MGVSNIWFPNIISNSIHFAYCPQNQHRVIRKVITLLEDRFKTFSEGVPALTVVIDIGRLSASRVSDDFFQMRWLVHLFSVQFSFQRGVEQSMRPSPGLLVFGYFLIRRGLFHFLPTDIVNRHVVVYLSGMEMEPSISGEKPRSCSWRGRAQIPTQHEITDNTRCQWS